MRNARWYLGGVAASLLGNSAMSLVAGIWVKALTGSSSEAGLASVCVYAPSLAAPVAGLIADRVPRQRWLFVLNLISAVTILALLLVRSRAQTWVIFVAMAAYGTETILIDPAESALFAEMLTPAMRRSINGLYLAVQETGRLVAPLFGAALFTLIGGGAVAALDAATFVIAATAISMVRLQGSTTKPRRESPAAELGAGARHIWGDPQLRVVVVAAAAIMAISAVGVAAQYSLVSALGQRPAFLGVLTAALGGGSVAASLTSGRLIARLGERRLAVVGLSNFTAGNLLRATHWMPAAVVGSFVLGFALPYVFLAVLNLAQRTTPSGIQGRVSATITLALFGPQAPMKALGALAIAHIGYGWIYIGSAALSAAIAAWLSGQARAARLARR